jgi:hypothetical protein
MTGLVFNPFTNKLDIAEQVLFPAGTVAFIQGDVGGSVAPDTNNVVYIQGNQIGNLGAIEFTGGIVANTIVAAVQVDGTSIGINPSGQLSVITGGLSYSEISTNTTAQVNSGYFCVPGAGITVTLPASPVLGDNVSIISDGPNLTIQANTGQFIQMSNATSVSAGTALNTLQGDSIHLIYRSSNSTWYAQSFNGSWTVT